jgi:hypothetical protein
MVTPDKDFAQLVSENMLMYKQHEWVCYRNMGVQKWKKFKLRAEQVVTF